MHALWSLGCGSEEGLHCPSGHGDQNSSAPSWAAVGELATSAFWNTGQHACELPGTLPQTAEGAYLASGKEPGILVLEEVANSRVPGGGPHRWAPR